MRVVGLTGGIGTGKSTVSRYLEERGLAIIDLDALSRKIYLQGSRLYTKIVDRFGADILDPNGEIDRRKLGELVFGDTAARRDLNSLTKPAITKQMGDRLVLLDAPLLYEVGLDRLVAEVIVIACSPEKQLQRVQDRDGFTAEEAKARINAQMSLADKVQKANYVLDNDRDKANLYAQIDKLIPKLRPGPPLRNYLLALNLVAVVVYVQYRCLLFPFLCKGP